MKKPSSSLLLIVPFLFLSCISTERAQPERRYHLIEAERSGAKSEQTAGIVRVRRFRISPRFDSRNLVYRTTDTAYETDFYNEFLTDPGSMLTESARKWLSASGRFKAVIDPSASLDEDAVLEGYVQTLYGDFRGAPSANMEVQVYLLRRGGGEDAIVFQKLYSKSLPLAAKSTDALLKGYSQCLSLILAELESDAGASTK